MRPELAIKVAGIPIEVLLVQRDEVVGGLVILSLDGGQQKDLLVFKKEIVLAACVWGYRLGLMKRDLRNTHEAIPWVQ